MDENKLCSEIYFYFLNSIVIIYKNNNFRNSFSKNRIIVCKYQK